MTIYNVMLIAVGGASAFHGGALLASGLIGLGVLCIILGFLLLVIGQNI